MSKAQDVISLAEKEIGTKAGKDCICKYTDEYGLHDQWCVIFQWWLAKHVGCPESFYGGKKVASCTSYYNWAKSKGYVVKSPEPGDLVIFQFGSNRHMGRCVTSTATTVTTIDGNTTKGSSNEYTGGEVLRKTRNKAYVYAYIRPQWPDAAQYHVVAAGDTLSKIAVKYGYSSYKDLLPLNPHIKNPNIIYKGQKIRVK